MTSAAAAGCVGGGGGAAVFFWVKYFHGDAVAGGFSTKLSVGDKFSIGGAGESLTGILRIGKKCLRTNLTVQNDHSHFDRNSEKSD